MVGDPLERGIGEDEIVGAAGRQGGDVGLDPSESGIVLPCVGQHVGRAVDARHLGVGPALRQEIGAVARAAAEIDDPPRRREGDTGEEVARRPGPLPSELQVLIRVPGHLCHGIRLRVQSLVPGLSPALPGRAAAYHEPRDPQSWRGGPRDGSGRDAIVMARSSSHKLVISQKGLLDWLTRGGIRGSCGDYAHFSRTGIRSAFASRGSRHDPVRAEGAILQRRRPECTALDLAFSAPRQSPLGARPRKCLQSVDGMLKGARPSSPLRRWSRR